MPAEIPASLRDLLTTDVLASIATVRPDGAPAIAHVWVDHVDGQVLTSAPLGSRKGRNVRFNDQVAVMVVDRTNPWRYLQMRGRVVEIRPDVDLAFIDRMSLRYRGQPYADRVHEREVFVIDIDHVKAAGA